jgi:hypothetical protein
METKRDSEPESVMTGLALSPLTFPMVAAGAEQVPTVLQLTDPLELDELEEVEEAEELVELVEPDELLGLPELLPLEVLLGLPELLAELVVVLLSKTPLEPLKSLASNSSSLGASTVHAARVTAPTARRLRKCLTLMPIYP